MRISLPSLVFPIALAAGPAVAKNWQVGPTRALKQLQAVVDSLKAGDTVRVDGDATYAGGVLFTEPGAPGRPIVILGVRVNGKRPVLSGATNTVHFQSDGTYRAGADHYVFQGFEVAGGSFRGIFHQAHDLTIRDVLVRDCPRHGILGADVGAGTLNLEFSEVRNCGQGSGNHQIYMSTDQVNRPGTVFRMRHCFVHGAAGGNNVKTRSERNEIHYNWIEGAYYHELELIGPDPGGVDDGWTPRMKREDADVVGNVFWKKRTAAANDSDFAVFRIGGDATGESHGRYRFVNNTVIAGTGAVFRCFDSLESVEMHNNVFHRPGGGVNLMRQVEADWTRGQAAIAGSNNWVTTGAANIPAQWTGTKQGSDPGFVDFASADLRPASGSPLLNAGAAIVQGPDGSPFANPLFPPAQSPPNRRFLDYAYARPAVGVLDIGAYEEGTQLSIGGLRSARSRVPGPWLRLPREADRLLAEWEGGWRDLSGREGSVTGGSQVFP